MKFISDYIVEFNYAIRSNNKDRYYFKQNLRHTVIIIKSENQINEIERIFNHFTCKSGRAKKQKMPHRVIRTVMIEVSGSVVLIRMTKNGETLHIGNRYIDYIKGNT